MQNTTNHYLFSVAKGARETRWNRQRLSEAELFAAFSGHSEWTQKDGLAFVPGTLVGTERKAAAVDAIYMLVYDIDKVQTLDEVKALVDASGFKAIVWTTYSHMKTETLIPTGGYIAWAKKALKDKDDLYHNQERVEQYIKAKDLYCPNPVVERQTKQTKDGVQIVVKHDPVHKMRVLFPLKSAFLFASHGYTSQEQILAYKTYYVGIGKKLGLNFDIACSDPPRLFYMPSHPPDSKDHEAYVFDGPERGYLEMIDFTPADEDETRQRTGDTTRVHSSGDVSRREGEHVIVEGANGTKFNVSDWWQRNGRGSGEVLIEALRQVSPETLVNDLRDDKQHIVCPFEDEHSQPGGTGTVVMLNAADPDGWPKIHCRHEHCTGRLNENFIAGLVEKGALPTTALDAMQRTMAVLRSSPDTAIIDIADFLSSQMTPAPLPASTEEVPADAEPLEESRRAQYDTLMAVLEELMAATDGALFSQRERFYRIIDLIDLEQFWTSAEGRELQRTPAFDIYVLAHSQISMNDALAYARRNVDALMLRKHEMQDFILRFRLRYKSLRNCADDMYSSRLSGEFLGNRVHATAAWYGVAVNVVREEFERVEREHVLPGQQEMHEAALMLNQRYAKLLRPNGDCVLIDIPESDAKGDVVIRTVSGAEKLNSNDYFEYATKDGRIKRTYTFEHWFRSIRGHQVFKDCVFDPSNKCPPNVYNKFRGFNAVPPVPGDWGMLADHLKAIWCRGSNELFNWLITHMANMIQQPEHRPHTAIVVIGGQGTGKSIVLEHGLCRIVSPYSRISNKRDELSSRFNATFATAILYVAEESIFSGDAAVMNTIKSYITSDALQIERKGMEAEQAPMFTRFYFLANDEHAVKLDPDDRRFFVLQTDPSRARDVKYFTDMRNWLYARGTAHFHHALKTWDPAAVGMSWSDISDAPMTATKVKQIQYSQDIPKRFMMDLLMNGTITDVREDAIEGEIPSWPLDKQVEWDLRLFKAAFRDYVAASGNRAHDRTKLPYVFNEIVGLELSKQTFRKPGENNIMRTVVVVPPRREILQKHLGKLVTQAEFDNIVSPRNSGENAAPIIHPERKIV